MSAGPEKAMVWRSSYDAEIPDAAAVEAVLEQMYLESLRALLRMDHPSGRRFLHLLMARCGLYAELPVADHAMMARAAGRRSVALDLFRAITDLDPDMPARMAREARVERDAISTEPEDARPGW